MNSQSIQSTIAGMEAIFQSMIELYDNYFHMLETVIERTPLSEVDKLKELHILVQEGQEALQADLALFNKAIAMDAEAINKMKDEMKIHDIYKKLHQS